MLFANSLAIEVRNYLANDPANDRATVAGRFAPANTLAKHLATGLASVAWSFARPDAPINLTHADTPGDFANQK